MSERIATMLTRDQIAERVRELGAQITRDYAGKNLVIVCVLKGSFVFASDLVRAVDLPLRVDFLGVRSYGEGTGSSGVVQITQDLSRPIEHEDVLLVEVISGKNRHSIQVATEVSAVQGSGCEPVGLPLPGDEVPDSQVFGLPFAQDHYAAASL